MDKKKIINKKKIQYVKPEEITSLMTLKEPNTEYQEIYLKERNIYLIRGDALKSNLFRKEFSDLIITSPPYNVDIQYNSHKDNLSYDKYLEFSEKWMQNCFTWSKPQGRFALNCPLDKNKGGQQSVGADLITIAKRIGWKYHSTIIWNEGNISRRTAWGSWLSASAPFVIAPVELIIIFYKDQWKKTSGSGISDIKRNEFIEWTNAIWSFNGESKKRVGHPAPFPRELPRRLIKLFSFVDDVIFDPFVGSGTTIIEAVNNHRIGVGLEIDSNYCEIAKRRILKEAIVFNPKLNLEENIFD